MKAKKKLLIGTAIMALAAGGASAVSTFAWFTARNSGLAVGSASDTTAKISSNAVQETISAVTIPGLTVTAAVTGDPVNLAHYSAAATANTENLATGYIDNVGKFHEVDSTEKTLSLGMTVTIAYDTTNVVKNGYVDSAGNAWSQADLITEFAKRTITLTVQPGASSRARIFVSTASSGDPTTAITEDIALSSMTTAASTIVKNYRVYVWGGTAANTASQSDASAVTNQGISVSLVDKTPIA